MKPVTMKQAAELVGTSKSTIYRMVKAGTLVPENKEADGTVKIDPSELARVFKDFVPGEAPQSKPIDVPSTPELELLRVQLQAAQEQISDLKRSREDLISQRDKWQQEAEDWKTTNSNNQVLLLGHEEAKAQPQKRAGLLGALLGR